MLLICVRPIRGPFSIDAPVRSLKLINVPWEGNRLWNGVDISTIEEALKFCMHEAVVQHSGVAAVVVGAWYAEAVEAVRAHASARVS